MLTVNSHCRVVADPDMVGETEATMAGEASHARKVVVCPCAFCSQCYARMLFNTRHLTVLQDFSFIGRAVPSCFLFLGIRNETVGSGGGHICIMMQGLGAGGLINLRVVDTFSFSFPNQQ